MPERLERGFRFLGEIERYEEFLRLFHSSEREDELKLEALKNSRDPLVALTVLKYAEEIPERRSISIILDLAEGGNEVVAGAAMASYARNHYPGKARLLKRLIVSSDPAACRFAVRTLARAGFAEALPLVLRELPERDGAVREEMIQALRFLPDRRAAPVLLSLAESPEEKTRFLALQVLSELHQRLGVLPARYFVRRAHDESERVRAVALDALQRESDPKVARLFLEEALRREAPAGAREKAVRALASFPSSDWVEPLVGLLVSEESAALKLSVEIVFRSLGDKRLRRGLWPLLTHHDAATRCRAALLAAEFFGEEEETRRELVACWRRAGEDESLELIDVLRELGGSEAVRLLREAMRGSDMKAYLAAGAMVRLRGEEVAAEIMALLEDASVARTVKRTLLSHWARRRPEPALRERLLAWLLPALGDRDFANIRYLSLRTLAWYPLEQKLGAILDLLAREEFPDIVRLAYRQLLKDLGPDPMLLARAWAAHPQRDRLRGHAVRVLTGQAWDPGTVEPLLSLLAAPPLSLSQTHPESFFAVCAHLVERSGASLERVWTFLKSEDHQTRFLLLLLSFARSARRRFPPLPIAFLVGRLPSASSRERGLFYELLSADGRAEAAEALAGALVAEKDERALRAGRRALAALIEAPR